MRELENRIEAAAALTREPKLTPAALGLANTRPRTAVRPDRIELSFKAYERACLEAALESAQGDVRRAASLLGVGRSTLYRKLSEHGLRP